MAYFNKRSKDNYTPDPPKQVPIEGTGLVLNLWDKKSEQGRRIHWSIGRQSNDSDATYKTLRVESLFDLPLFVQRVAQGFAKFEDLPSELRKELGNLALAMAQVVELLTANGSERSDANSLSTSFL